MEFLIIVVKIYFNILIFSLVVVLECFFVVLKYGFEGKCVFFCRRVCGEFLKMCMNFGDVYYEVFMDIVFGWCLGFLDEDLEGDNCFELFNIILNDSLVLIKMMIY